MNLLERHMVINAIENTAEDLEDALELLAAATVYVSDEFGVSADEVLDGCKERVAELLAERQPRGLRLVTDSE